MSILTTILVVLAAIFKSIMDLSSEDKLRSFWWNKSTGWVYKYKNGDKNQGPAFPLSTTALVFLTDGWHLMQFFFHTCWQTAIAINLDLLHPVILVLIMKIIYGTFFEAVRFINSRRKE